MNATITERQKQTPVTCDADVVVAGAGVAGTFTAIAAARSGARTVLVDRFGSVGGNIGPGYIVNGHMVSGRPHPSLGYEATIYPGLYGIGKEFLTRYAEIGGKGVQPHNRPEWVADSYIASDVARAMLEEAGAVTLLSTQVADPIIESGCVQGVFVENKSGRSAITAKVTVDATGEADLARRAGAPTLHPKAEYHELDGHSPVGMGNIFLFGNIDWEEYEDFLRHATWSEEDVDWCTETYGDVFHAGYKPFVAFLRSAHQAGTFSLINDSIELDGNQIEISASWPARIGLTGCGQGRGRVQRTIPFDIGNGWNISKLESALRKRIFEVWRFHHEYVPGFQNSVILTIAPFLGSRGGPVIEGEYTLTMQDCREGKRFDDVLYLYGETRALRWTTERGGAKWADMPYRVMLPKTLDGMLAAGRSASGIPDTLLRNRMGCMVMGEACGRAAALAVSEGVAPKQLDVKLLQGALLDAGFYLGDRHRIKELGLI